MLRFKQYIQLLETLTDTQRSWVDQNMKSTNVHDHLFANPPEGATKIDDNTFTIPAHKEEVDRSIENYIGELIKPKGYKVHDYVNGIAAKETPYRDSEGNTKTKTVHVNLAKALSHAINDPKSLDAIKDVYAADPRVQNRGRPVEEGDHEIVISRDPYHVAGMSSGRNWGSCMTIPGDAKFSTGIRFYHKIPNDLAHGTLVAYLAKKGAVKPNQELDKDDVLARTLIKKYKDEDGNVIFRPEHRSYSQGFDYNLNEKNRYPNFDSSVSDFAKKVWTPKSDKVHTLIKDLYNDGDNIVQKLSPEQRKTASDELVKKLNDRTYTPEDIKAAIGGEYYDAGRHGHLLTIYRKEMENSLLKKFAEGKHTDNDLDHAKDYGYITNRVKAEHINYMKKNPIYHELRFAEENNYLPEELKDKFPDALINSINQRKHTKEDLDHAKTQGYLTKEVKAHLANHLIEKIKQKTHTNKDLDQANEYGYMTKDVKYELSAPIIRDILHGKSNETDITKIADYMNDDLKDLLAKPLIEKIYQGTHTVNDLKEAEQKRYLTKEVKDAHLHYFNLMGKQYRINNNYDQLKFANNRGYLPEKLKEDLPSALSKLIARDGHTIDDLYNAANKNYFTNEHFNLLADNYLDALENDKMTNDKREIAEKFKLNQHKDVQEYFNRPLIKRIESGQHDIEELMYGDLTAKVKDAHIKYLTKNHNYREMLFAKVNKYLPQTLEQEIPNALTQLITQRHHTRNDIDRADYHGVLRPIHHQLLDQIGYPNDRY